MPEPSIPPLNARLCRRVSALTLLSGLTFFVANLALWLVPRWTDTAARLQANLQAEPIALTPSVQALGLLVSSLSMATLFWALWTARRLLLRLAAGDVLQHETGVRLRQFGVAILAYAGVAPITTALTCYLVTMGNPPGQTLIRLGISDGTLVLALVGTVIMAIGSVLAEAAEVADEHRQII